MEQELSAGGSQVNQPRSRSVLGPEALDAITLYKAQPSTDVEWAEVSKPLSKQVRCPAECIKPGKDFSIWACADRMSA